jgi:hypothetical protein
MVDVAVVTAVCNNPGRAAFFGFFFFLRNLKCPCRMPHILASSCPMNMIFCDLESYEVGLQEYVIILRNRDNFSKEAVLSRIFCNMVRRGGMGYLLHSEGTDVYSSYFQTVLDV